MINNNSCIPAEPAAAAVVLAAESQQLTADSQLVDSLAAAIHSHHISTNCNSVGRYYDTIEVSLYSF